MSTTYQMMNLAIEKPDFELEVSDEMKANTRKVAMFVVAFVVGAMLWQNAKPQSMAMGQGMRFGAKGAFCAMLLALFLFEPDLIAPALNMVFGWFISLMEFTGLVSD